MQPSPKPSLAFRKTSKELFGPRLGHLSVNYELNHKGRRPIEIPTPGILISAPRGVVPHLSQDHLEKTTAVKWLNIPLETFLERNPPLLAIRPLHDLCGFNPEKHLVSLSLRDYSDLRHVPPNGEKHVTVLSARGAKKVSPSEYKSLLGTIQPDIILAQSDIAIAPPPHSQKRSNKSIERSFHWLLELLSLDGRPQNIFAQLVGGPIAQARASFSRSLLEPFDDKERLQVSDLKNLDDGVVGYAIDITSLQHSLPEETGPEVTPELLRTSLEALPDGKPRLVTGSTDPYQVLKLIREVGVDIFDTQWAFDAAQWGVALDFSFPPPPAKTRDPPAQRRVGHNLYDVNYAVDSNPLTDAFLPGSSTSNNPSSAPICDCVACSPEFEVKVIDHSPLTSELLRSRGITSHPTANATAKALPMTRAYLHHLLQTHEMLAHALLVSHNLAVVEAFFAGIRRILSLPEPDQFTKACDAFRQIYPEDSWGVLEQGKRCWTKVDKERGKGRLARDRDADVEGA